MVFFQAPQLRWETGWRNENKNFLPKIGLVISFGVGGEELEGWIGASGERWRGT